MNGYDIYFFHGPPRATYNKLYLLQDLYQVVFYVPSYGRVIYVIRPVQPGVDRSLYTTLYMHPVFSRNSLVQVYGAQRHFQRYFIQLYYGSQIYWWRKQEYPEKTTKLMQVMETLSHNVVSSSPRHEQCSNSQILVVIGTDCIDSCKSNNHAFMGNTTCNNIVVGTITRINNVCIYIHLYYLLHE